MAYRRQQQVWSAQAARFFAGRGRHDEDVNRGFGMRARRMLAVVAAGAVGVSAGTMVGAARAVEVDESMLAAYENAFGANRVANWNCATVSGTHCESPRAHSYDDNFMSMGAGATASSGQATDALMCAYLDQREGDKFRIRCKGGGGEAATPYIPKVVNKKIIYFAYGAQHTSTTRYIAGNARF